LQIFSNIYEEKETCGVDAACFLFNRYMLL
jgi:hypothetical protein